MIPRHLEPAIRTALRDTPAVMVAGPRQAGKTTLVRQIRPHSYVTLDRAVPRSAASSDPEAFLASLAQNSAIDEVQRAPELFLAMKALIDEERIPGNFLLTGSADVLALPRIADALPGRMEFATLWPFSQGEIEGRVEHFVDLVFNRRLPALSKPPLPRRQLLERVADGGFPDVLGRSNDRRVRWFDAYLEAVVQREAMDITAINDPADLHVLARLIAARNASLLNLADIARDARLAHSTARRYLRLLESLFLVVEIPAWSTNLTSRAVRSPKVVLSDSGLVAHLLGLNARRLEADPILVGSILEGFVAMEVLKQVGWSRQRPRLFHFRDRSHEVDLVLERRDGDLVGIEVKASSIVKSDDFRGLRALSERAGAHFVRGIVLYGGKDEAAFGPQFVALPVQALWDLASH